MKQLLVDILMTRLVLKRERAIKLLKCIGDFVKEMQPNRREIIYLWDIRRLEGLAKQTMPMESLKPPGNKIK